MVQLQQDLLWRKWKLKKLKRAKQMLQNPNLGLLAVTQ